jgi:hypothetical protein
MKYQVRRFKSMEIGLKAMLTLLRLPCLPLSRLANGLAVSPFQLVESVPPLAGTLDTGMCSSWRISSFRCFAAIRSL